VAGTVVQWEAAARRSTGDEVDSMSERGSRGGHRARGGGSGAQRAVARREGVEVVQRGDALRRQ
jgi:hypothetical protein